METTSEIKQLKEELKGKAAAISEARKEARADLAAARGLAESDPAGAAGIREKAVSLLAGAKALGGEQRALLLRYAWARDRKYRRAEARTLADKLGDCWEARMLREALAKEVARGIPGADAKDLLFWMARDVLPSEVAGLRAEIEAAAAVEEELGRAFRRAERAQKELEDVTALVARLDGQGTFALELARKRLENAGVSAKFAASSLAEAKRRAFRSA